MNKKRIGKICVSILILIVCGCKLHGDEKTLYKIDAKLVHEENSEFYEKAGLECVFYNSFPKTVDKIIIVFSLFDNNGEYFTKPIYKAEGKIGNMEYIQFILNLDEYINDINPKNLFVDFVYVSKIFFDDGTQWDDPYGLKYFLKK